MGYTAYAKEPEIKTTELTIAYGEELQAKLVKTSDDVVKTEFKTKLEKKLGKQSVKVDVENLMGNHFTKDIEVNVVDKEKPVIKSEGSYEVGVGSEFNVKEHVKATDNYDGDISNKVVVSEFNTSELGEKKVNVSVSDTSNNVTTKEIILKVVDKAKPEINAENKSVSFGESINLLNGVSANDNVDGDITSKIEVVGSVDTNKVGTYDITYKVKDSSNNETLKTIKVDVKQQEAPKVEEKKEEAQKPQPTEKKVEAPKPTEQPKEESKPVQKQEVAQTQQAKSQPKPVQKQEAPKSKPMTITFNGKTLTYVNGGQSRGQQIIDTTNKISTWGGAPFNGEDGMNTHFIGHSPGNFDGIWNASSFVITDGNGKAYTYKTTKVYKVYQKNAIGVADGVDYWDRVTGTGGGERVTFQTCAVSDSSIVWIVETVRA
ncbi:Probable cell surface protein [Bacillus thuringiensis serovar israelensis ATCC 35646]|nr:Probable cell surface protein [Bacillus thuringiensis serovar israelensis ATCC 35646]